MNWSVEERRNFAVRSRSRCSHLVAFGRAARAQDADENWPRSQRRLHGDLRRKTTGGIAAAPRARTASISVPTGPPPLFLGPLHDKSLVTHLGGDINDEFVGALHGVNNIEAPNAWRVS
jgi:hypothetical protein